MTGDVAFLVRWGEVALILAAIATTAYPALYAFSPWFKSQLGRVIMLKAVAFAVAMDTTVWFYFSPPSNLWWAYFLNAAILSLIALATTFVTLTLWRMNYSQKKSRSSLMNDSDQGRHIANDAFPETHKLLNDETYNKLKWFTLIVLPAFGTLYVFLAPLWELPKAMEVSTSITGLVTFLGVVLGLSTRAYNNSVDKYDGHITVEENEDGIPVASLHLKNYVNPADIVNQEQVLFKVQK